jgi:uncharacterized protein (DUF952 family)
MSKYTEPPADASPLEKQGHVMLHLAPTDVWEQQRANPSYLPEQFAVDGFIHCTDSVEDVIAVGNRYYQSDPRPYVLLDIYCDRVAAPIVYEDGARIFPHIYGALETSAVARTRTVKRTEDGGFLSIGDQID